MYGVCHYCCHTTSLLLPSDMHVLNKCVCASALIAFNCIHTKINESWGHASLGMAASESVHMCWCVWVSELWQLTNTFV